MARLVLEQLCKHFPGGVVAVDDLSLTVADGELLVLVGPSGCGKTTTLRLIAGLEEPTRGTVRIGEQVVNGRPPHRRDVAMVFQRAALYPHLSVRDNLAFGLRLYGGYQPLVAQRVAEAARMLGLEDVLERRPAQLSGGQQQRVALGRAVVRQPAVFLLDEPLSGLDPPLRAELRRELHLLHRRLSATMIYVTHDQVEALALGDRVAVLERGRLHQVDRPQALYERPADRFVAGFIGWPPMNFLDGRLTSRDGQLGLLVEGCWLPVPAEVERPVTLGFRPEAVTIGPADREGAATAISMEVVAVEPLGGRWLVTLRRSGWQLTSRLDEPPRFAEGQTVTVNLDMQQAHWFDRLTGAALGRTVPAG
jgi:multiple sugar transport system ATP-binding protein